MSKSQRRAAVLATTIALALPGQAFAAFNWMYVAESKELIGMTSEDEGDTDFRATCKPQGKAEIGIGAEEGIGTGKGEAVTLTLATGAHNLRLDGKSKESPNFQMTGGVELQTQVDGPHALFQLLADPGPIKVSGGAKPMSWPAAGRAAALKAFTKACFKK